MFSCLGLSAQVTFSTQNFIESRFFSQKNCAADMNGDMLDDIVGIGPNILAIYYQEPDGSFTNRNFRQYYSTMDDWSICAGDIDGNGYNDLLIGGQQNVSFIYANDNGSGYEDVTMTEYIFSQRTSFADINNDGHLDAFICHDEDENHPYRNDGSGGLTLDRDLIKTPENTPGNYVCTWVDYDNDGDTDMYLTKCVSQAQSGDPSRTNLLYTNDGNGNYVENGAAANLDDNDQSWVSLFEDYDNDGDFDVIILNHESRNLLMRNNGDGTFTDVILGSGFDAGAVGSYEGLAADFDNDGNMDFITDFPQSIYYGNGDLTFTKIDVAAPAGALGDFNSDGFIDILYNGTIYRNDANGNNWLRVNTIGSESNRNGLGARLELYGAWGVQIREVRATQSWSPMSTMAIHFGLEQATSIDSLVIKWPSGNKSSISNPSINQALTIDESGCNFERPELEVSGDLFLCPGMSVSLSAPAGYTDYKWSTGDNSETLQVSEAGSYNLTMTNSDGCTVFTKNVVVSSIEEKVKVYAPFGIEFCPGNETYLEVDTPYDVVWNNSSTEKFIYTFEEGEFYATIQNDCGVTVNSDTIVVSEYQAEPPVVEDIFVYPDTSLAVLHVDGAFVIWWDEPDGGTVLFTGNDYFVSEFLTDQTFYVQIVHFLDNGTECYSPRVPISIFLLSGTSEIEQELDLSVYPNPAQSSLSISVNDVSRIKGMQLLDVNGKVVLDKREIFDLTSTLDVGTLEAGVYILQIRVEDALISKRVMLTGM